MKKEVRRKDEKGKNGGMMHKIPETETKCETKDKGEWKIIIKEEQKKRNNERNGQGRRKENMKN